MRTFRPLKADEIECRISTITEKGCSLLLYKTARTDYALLDEKFGIFNWQNRYEVIDGKMYCGIGVFDTGKNTWVWKYNCGTESNTEAEKGQASDAMKRAGFAWGIGTELYSAPFIWIPREALMKFAEKNGKFYVKDSFSVKEIGYNESEEINKLVIVNQDNNVVFPQRRQPERTEKPRAEKPELTVKNVCSSCGETVPDIVRDFSLKKYGRVLCRGCQQNVH